MPLEPVRLSEIVPGVVSIYQPLTREKGIMLAYTVPTDLPPVWCVSGGLRQIVINPFPTALSSPLKVDRFGYEHVFRVIMSSWNFVILVLVLPIARFPKSLTAFIAYVQLQLKTLVVLV
jgi:hypothetical protein